MAKLRKVDKKMRELQKNETVKKAQKGIFHFLFSRIAVLGVLMLLQLGTLYATFTYLSEYATYINTTLNVLKVCCIIYIMNGKGNSDFKITWILLIFIFHVFGTIFYLFVKIMPGTGMIKTRLSDLNVMTLPFMKQDKETLEALRVSKPANANLAHYMSEQVHYPVHRNTAVKYFASGEEKFEEMKKQLEKAEKYIFLEYFIVERGEMWNSILRILLKKVKQGDTIVFDSVPE